MGLAQFFRLSCIECKWHIKFCTSKEYCRTEPTSERKGYEINSKEGKFIKTLHGKKYLPDHLKTLKTQHLNGSKLHLNRRGAPVLQTPCKFLSRNFNWCFEENSAKIAIASSNAPQSDKESTSEQNQTTNEENTNIRPKNVNKLIIAHLNINSLRNKFEFLISQIKDNVNVLMISETKLKKLNKKLKKNESFPTN